MPRETPRYPGRPGLVRGGGRGKQMECRGTQFEGQIVHGGKFNAFQSRRVMCTGGKAEGGTSATGRHGGVPGAIDTPERDRALSGGRCRG